MTAPQMAHLAWGGLQLAQGQEMFRLSLDAVLLADFVAIKNQDTVGDLGAGNGALSLLLSCRAPKASFTGLELQPELVSLAQQNVAINQLSQVRMIQGDLRQAGVLLGRGRFTLVVANPPYFTPGQGRISPNPQKAAARSEIFCTLEDVVREGAGLLNSGGRLALVHRAERLADLCVLMSRYGVTPKRLRLVQPGPDQRPNLLLLEGIRAGKPGLTVEAPLIVYQTPQVYSEEVTEIFAGRSWLKK